MTTNVLHHFFTNAHFVRKRLTRDETRDRIMIKADELFRQFGFGKTTVAELGMSPANIYKFFSSKEAIIQASADRSLVVLREAVHWHRLRPVRRWIESKGFS